MTTNTNTFGTGPPHADITAVVTPALATFGPTSQFSGRTSGA